MAGFRSQDGPGDLGLHLSSNLVHSILSLGMVCGYTTVLYVGR